MTLGPFKIREEPGQSPDYSVTFALGCGVFALLLGKEFLGISRGGPIIGVFVALLVPPDVTIIVNTLATQSTMSVPPRLRSASTGGAPSRALIYAKGVTSLSMDDDPPRGYPSEALS